MHNLLLILLIITCLGLIVITRNTLSQLKTVQNDYLLLKNSMESLTLKHIVELKEAREDAVKKSRYVNKGFAAETFTPFNTKWSPKDFNHLGQPVDYIIFDGSEEVRGGSDTLNSIVILDVKTGNAQLTPLQRRIKECVIAGRITFAIYNPDKEETKEWTVKHLPSDTTKENLEST